MLQGGRPAHDYLCYVCSDTPSSTKNRSFRPIPGPLLRANPARRQPISHRKVVSALAAGAEVARSSDHQRSTDHPNRVRAAQRRHDSDQPAPDFLVRCCASSSWAPRARRRRSVSWWPTRGYHSNQAMSDLRSISVRSYVAEPNRGRRQWINAPDSQRAVYGTRRHLRRGRPPRVPHGGQSPRRGGHRGDDRPRPYRRRGPSASPRSTVRASRRPTRSRRPTPSRSGSAEPI